MVSGQKEQTEIDNLHEQVRLLKDEYCTIYDDYKNELDSSKNNREENDWLHDVLENYEKEEVCLYDTDKNVFLSNCQLCVYQLLENYVPSKHVGPVINIVLSLIRK